METCLLSKFPACHLGHLLRQYFSTQKIQPCQQIVAENMLPKQTGNSTIILTIIKKGWPFHGDLRALFKSLVLPPSFRVGCIRKFLEATKTLLRAS